MTSKRTRIAVNGYGIIGKRVADALGNGRRTIRKLLLLLVIIPGSVALAGCGALPPALLPSGTPTSPVVETPSPRAPTATAAAPAENTPTPESGAEQAALKTVMLRVSGFT